MQPSEAESEEYANQYYFYHYDVRGSVTNILSPAGTVVKGYDYDEFGQSSKKGDDNFLNEMTFTGSVMDATSGLQYMNARYYQPSTGRFLSQDTYSGNPYDPWTQHLYSYTGNNPINMIDPTGHKADYILAASNFGDYKKKSDYILAASNFGDYEPRVTPQKSIGSLKPSATLGAASIAGSTISGAWGIAALEPTPLGEAGATVVSLAMAVALGVESVIYNAEAIGRGETTIGEALAKGIATATLGGTIADALSKAQTRERHLDKPLEKHHIVPKAHPEAADARTIFMEAGMSINDPQNLVQISYDLHKPLHSKLYVSTINGEIVMARNAAIASYNTAVGQGIVNANDPYARQQFIQMGIRDVLGRYSFQLQTADWILNG